MLPSVTSAFATAALLAADALGEDVEIHGLVAPPAQMIVKAVVGDASSSPRIREASILLQAEVVVTVSRSLFSDAQLDALSRCLFSVPSQRLVRVRSVLIVVDSAWVDIALKG